MSGIIQCIIYHHINIYRCNMCEALPVLPPGVQVSLKALNENCSPPNGCILVRCHKDCFLHGVGRRLCSMSPLLSCMQEGADMTTWKHDACLCM